MKSPRLPRMNFFSLVIGVGLCFSPAACTAPESTPVSSIPTETVEPSPTFTPPPTLAPTQLPTLNLPATQALIPAPTSPVLHGPGTHEYDFPLTYTIDQVREGIERAKLSQAKAIALLEYRQVKDGLAEGQSLLESLGFSTDPAQGIYARAEMVPVVQTNADGSLSWWMAAVDQNGELLGWLFIKNGDELRAASEPLILPQSELSLEDVQILSLEAASMPSTKPTWALIMGKLVLVALDEEGNPAQWFNPSAGIYEPLALQIWGNIHILNAPMTQLEAYQLSASDCRFMDAANTCPSFDSYNPVTNPETCGEIWDWSSSLLDHTAEMLGISRQDILSVQGQANPQNNGCFALGMLVHKQWLLFWENTSGQIVGVPVVANMIYIPITIK